MMDWNMITAISTAFMALVIFVTAIFVAYQLKDLNRIRCATYTLSNVCLSSLLMQYWS